MELEKETKLIGTVKWFNNVKGYGFIRHSSGKDVFVHYSAIEDEGFKTLNEGEEVVYQLDERVRGLYAKKVSRSGDSLVSGGHPMAAESRSEDNSSNLNEI